MEFLMILAILPGVIIAFLVYSQDKKEKEPKGEIIKAFLFGIVAAILALSFSSFCRINILEVDCTNWIELFLYSFLGVALIEEFSKWLCAYLFLRKNKEYDYLFDGIVYITLISLGFATIENILYTVRSGFFTGMMRAITTVPAHAFFGIISGYFFSLSKKKDLQLRTKNENKYFLLSLVLPVLLHGFYDFCLLSQNLLFYIMYLVFIVMIYSMSIYHIKKLQAIDEPFDRKDN